MININKIFYFDNCAATAPDIRVINTMCDVMKNCYANAASTHNFGINSQKIIENAKKYILNFLNTDGHICFTSGGTEANNIAIFGGARAKKRSYYTKENGNKKKFGKIITTSSEHASVLSCIPILESEGFEVIVLNPNTSGEFDLKLFEEIIDKNTILVSVMFVNNETGAINPIKKISEIIQKKSKSLLHVDAVQAFGKIPIDITNLNIDLMSCSAHKIHGPKGIGFVYISQNLNINPIIYGEGPEKFRPGTLPVELIAGFEAAIRNCDLIKDYNHVLNLNNYLRKKLVKLNNIFINSPKNSLAYIINFSIKGIKSEIMLNFLSANNIFLSAASACSGHKKSHVLASLNLPEDLINSAIRVGFSKFNNFEEIEFLVQMLQKAYTSTIKI
ncbi:MAG: cysteine desulfurase [Candidatus Improbicoccus devescovinae]|nr:MAG: cysteine desulfurase [Candidatus Improbicoccus devescovinae]